ncbi:MAG: cobalamin-binding protein [Bacteroidia bacterium]|nr:MAG: cobalamin-binding protein [Bacteroidia bacterium]
MMRIISLVPSLTELLFHLGLNDEVVGITKFCIHPKNWLHTKTHIGGTKNIHIDTIKGLQPSLVIANKEENVKDQIEEIQHFTEVLLTDIDTIDQALEAIVQIGNAVNKSFEAKELAHVLAEKIRSNKMPLVSKKALYFIWKVPYMVAAKNTFIDEMMRLAGFENGLKDAERYPIVSEEEIKAIQPDYILLSSEPYPFKEKHIEAFQKITPSAKIILVDGEMFSWYGNRMLLAVEYFKQLHFNIDKN